MSRGLDHFRDLRLAQGFLDPGQTGLLLLVETATQLGVGGEPQGGAMSVIQQVSPDQGFKVMRVCRQTLPDFVKRPLEIHQFERILIVDPGGQHAQHDGQSDRKSTGVVFPQLEFHCIHGSGDRVRIDPLADKRFECVDDQFLDLFGMAFTGAFKPGRKDEVAHLGFHANPGQILTQARIEQGFTQWGSRCSDQNVTENAQAVVENRV